MPATYDKLWIVLVEKRMKKKDLMSVTGLSQATIGKLGRNETVTSDVLIRICEALRCDIGEIMEVTIIESDSKENKQKKVVQRNDEI